MNIHKLASLPLFYLASIWQFIVSFFCLLILMFGFSSPSFAKTDKGFSLVDGLVGSYGDATSFIKNKATSLLDDSGITAAASEAQNVLTGLAEGAVPVIDDLSDPIQDNAEKAIAKAITKVELSTKVLKKITGKGAKAAIKFITESALFENADYGFTTPTGHIRIYRKGKEVSLCQTIVGPLGSVIISGISSAEQLCNFPDSRMSNPTKSLLAFTYMAAGHTHIRTNKVLSTPLQADLTLLPAPITAETYVQTIGKQWVQIRLAGADPASLTLQAKFEVGVKVNVSYAVDIEVEGEAALSIIDLKPLYAAEVIRSTGEVMLKKATSLGLNMDEASLSSGATKILKAGINHLKNIEPKYDEGLGSLSIDVKLTSGIGVGVADTAISLLSTNSTFNLTAPLAAFVEMGADMLEEYLNVGLAMADANVKLGTAIMEGKQSALANYQTDVQTVTDAFFAGVLTNLLKMSTQITSIETTYTLSALGDADKESTVLFESGLKIPVGVLSANLQSSPNPIAGAFNAASYLLLSAIDPQVVISDQTWTDLEAVIVPGIEFTILVLNPSTLDMTGFREADLLDTIKAIATIRNILVSMISSNKNESLTDLRSAIDNATTAAENAVNDAFFDWLNQVEFVKSISAGTNGSVGAEAVAEVGVSIGVEGKMSGSLFLLALNSQYYQRPEDGLLSSASIPVNFSLDAGASAGEGVEVTVDAGGAVSLNLFELRVTHWKKKLPTSALMKVAGFSVLEFDGDTNLDKSIVGDGILMLPMGGIVFADFEVDSVGSVTKGSWSGGIDLGPLGKFSWIEGELDDEGLHGLIDVSLLGAEFSAEFTLNSAGLLLGSYQGALSIAGQDLAEVNVFIGDDGKFSGSYQGEMQIVGFSAISDLRLNNEGFTGSSYLNVLGSELIADDLLISRSGDIQGVFTGTLQAGPHTLSAVSLELVNGGLIGTATMNLPDLENAQVELRIMNGEVMAFYRGELLNGLISQASFGISKTGILVNATFNTSQFPSLSAQVLDLVSVGAELAQDQLAIAQGKLEEAQQLVDKLEADITNISEQVLADLEAAQQKVLAAEQDVQVALNKLNELVAEIDKLNSGYENLLSDAQRAVKNAQDKVNRASNSITYYQNKIRNLDRWYNGLSQFKKFQKSLYYTGQRVKLVGLRDAAQIKHTGLQVIRNSAQAALNVLNSELADLLSPLNIAREGLQTTYDKASDTLRLANDALSEINIDPDLLSIFTDLDVARDLLRVGQELVNRLSGSIAMVEYMANQGAENAFSVLSANFKVELSQLLQGSSFSIDARVKYLGQLGQISLLYDQSDIVDSFYQAVRALDSGTSTSDNSDMTAPDVVAKQSAQWTFDRSLVQLVAEDNFGGSGVASITYSASGAQILQQVSVAGNQAFALINVEGVTTLSFYATDSNGNVSATTTVNVNIDNSGPQISAAASGINAGVYEVAISAEDLAGSGISYITVSASGAEYITEIFEVSNSMVIALTQSGATTLFITAVDVAGNSSKLEFDVEVPELPNDVDPGTGAGTGTDPASESSGSSGGALSVMWMLMSLLIVCLRRMQPALIVSRNSN